MKNICNININPNSDTVTHEDHCGVTLWGPQDIKIQELATQEERLVSMGMSYNTHYDKHNDKDLS